MTTTERTTPASEELSRLRALAVLACVDEKMCRRILARIPNETIDRNLLDGLVGSPTDEVRHGAFILEKILDEGNEKLSPEATRVLALFT